MIYRLFGFGLDVGRSTLRAGIVMGEFMRTLTRRSFLIASAALPVGCAANRLQGIAASAPSATLRPPMTGQTWRYAKHDLFTGTLLDTQVDRVSAVDRTIDIASHTEGDTAAEMPSTGASGWRNEHTTLHSDITENTSTPELSLGSANAGPTGSI